MTTLATPRLSRSHESHARNPAAAPDERPLLQDPRYAVLNLLFAALMQGAPSFARRIPDSSSAQSKIENEELKITAPEVHHGS